MWELGDGDCDWPAVNRASVGDHAIRAGPRSRCRAVTERDWRPSRTRRSYRPRRDDTIAIRSQLASSANSRRAFSRPVSQPNRVSSLPSIRAIRTRHSRIRPCLLSISVTSMSPKPNTEPRICWPPSVSVATPTRLGPADVEIPQMDKARMFDRSLAFPSVGLRPRAENCRHRASS